MLTHEHIWAAIDEVAAAKGISASALARMSGLDPTTFNRSKRVNRDGKPRWPSTESISKILEATGLTVHQFVGLMGVTGGETRLSGRRVPLVPLGRLAAANGLPSAKGQVDAIDLAVPVAPDVVAVQIDSDAWRPALRRGDRLVAQAGADLRRGDRTIVAMQNGDVVLGEMDQQTALRMHLLPLVGGGGPIDLSMVAVAAVWRVLWIIV